MFSYLQKTSEILNSAEKKQLFWLVVTSFLLGISEIFGLGILIPILNLFLNPNSLKGIPFFQWLFGILNISDSQEFTKLLVIVGIILFVLKMVYTLFVRYYQGYVVAKINSRISDQVLSSYLEKEYQFHLQNNSSLLFRNVTSEVGNYAGAFLNSIVLAFSEVITIISILCLLFFAYPTPTLLAVFLSLIVAYIAYIAVNERLKKSAVERNIYSEALYKNAMEALQGIKEIKITDSQGFFVNNYAKSFWAYSKSHINYTVISTFPRNFIEAVVLISFLAIMLISILNEQDSQNLIPILATLAVAAVRVLPSIISISQYINTIQYYSSSADTVYKILKETQEVTKSKTVKTTISTTKNDINIQNISFSYKADIPLFQNLSLTIQPMLTTAFVGESGSGKSTLVDILMGLLIPQEGGIFYGETQINEENSDSFRAKIGYVSQQIFLYDATLAENIAFGVPTEQMDSQKLKKAIHLAQLEEVVNLLPEGLQTMIGEKGVRLSGGQRQRIGIARALYRNPEILIFDEATSALDGNTEAEVNKAIKNLQKDVTIIIVAHRLQTIQQADWIFVLEKGKILDQGTFEHLKNNSADFQRITHQPNS